MNEIKIRYAFRNKKTREIVLHCYTLSEIEYFGETIYTDKEDYELISRGLWTCLKDSNGKDIYAGDYIKITYDSAFSKEPFYVGVVEYLEKEDYPAFDLRPWIDLDMNAISWLKSESDPSVKKYEVIGDVYHNPELLEGAE